jgi:hypothetical protein
VVNRLRPLASDDLASALHKHSRVVVLEDHFAETGLFSSLCQLAASRKMPVTIESRAPTNYMLTVGTSPSFFLRSYRGDAASLAEDLR